MLLGVDVGGTFTDAVLLDSERILSAKVPTTTADQSAGVIGAITEVLRSAAADASDVERFVHGMTVGTNALLEEKVAPTALLATAGFTDLEELRRQTRADLYRLCAGHPPPLVPRERRVAVPERTGPDGPIQPLDEARLDKQLAELFESDDIDAAAVCLLWGFRYPEHERRTKQLIERGHHHVHVSTSHETAAVFREYERCATTVVDAALSPLLRRYLERLAARAADAGLPHPEVMLSGGGVADASAAARHGSWTVLSGPAGGAVGAAALAARAGAADAVCLDMGGTSCDVSVVAGGAVQTGGGREVGGRALALPMVDVHTIGAGGGSVAWRDAGGVLRVGPRSAGADPGPACYSRGGGEPTVTDASLLLGHLDPARPLAGDVELDLAAARDAITNLARELDLTDNETAAGIVRVAAAEMARAVRVVTVERGVDPRPLALVAFGGAGPLHAAAIADELGMTRVLVPRASGVLSALGLVAGERRRDLVESVLLSGPDLTRDSIARAVARLTDRGRRELGEPHAPVRCSYDLRYRGQGFELTIAGDPEPDPANLRQGFERAHEERYGYADPEGELELVTVRAAVALPAPELPALGAAARGTRAHEPRTGSTLVELPESTVVVPAAWTASEDPTDGTLTLERTG